MKQNITLRLTKRSKPIFDLVEQIAKNKSVGQFAPTLLDLIELGIQSYKSGNRIIDNHVTNLNSHVQSYSTFNEVAESLYSSLVGSITELIRYEQNKLRPNKISLKYYKQINKALWIEKSDFFKFNDDEIKNKSSIISPIIKAIRLTKSLPQKAQVIKQEQKFFDQLIAKYI